MLIGWRPAMLVLLVASVASCGVLALSTRVSPGLAALCAEFLFWLVPALALARTSRTRLRFAVALGLPMVAIATTHVIKLAMLGAPLYSGDVLGLAALLEVLDGWRYWLVLTTVLAVVTLWAWSLRPRRGARWHALVLPAYLLAMVAAAPWLVRPLSLAWPSSGLAGGEALLAARGPSLILLMDFGERRLESANFPQPEQVGEALRGLGPARLAGPGFEPRNVHLVLLESIWDPLQLDGFEFSDDPFDPRFRSVWEAAGKSRVMSPAFGGATANAEFEVLCGLPAHRSHVTFQGDVRQPVPCLPRMLREAGYLVSAIHPNSAGFWNRDRVYPLLGFEVYRPIESFELDEFDGSFLSDASLFRQTLDWAAGETQRPRFDYIVTLGSHYPYQRDRRTRPDLVQVTPKGGLLENYANAARYTTAAFMDFLDAVLARDPDALVVAFGDHAPVLGANPDPYLAGAGVDRDAMVGTPLLIVDGGKGAVGVGDIPLHQLPTRVLELLGPEAPRMPHAPPPGPQRDAMERTTLALNALMVREDDGRWRVCVNEKRNCGEAAQLYDRLRTIRNDLIYGNRHGLALADAGVLARPVAMQVQRGDTNCELEVLAWGPQQIRAGQPFNVQADGSSAFWFNLGRRKGEPELRIGELAVPFSLMGQAGSASLATGQIPAMPGETRLAWQCGSDAPVTIGSLQVDAAEPSPADAAGSADCGMEVLDWGPRQADADGRFNVQADGSSALWFRLSGVSGTPAIVLAGEAMDVVFADGIASAARPAGKPLVEGLHPLGWACPGGRQGEIGKLRVGESDEEIVPARTPVPLACAGGIDAMGPSSLRVGQSFNPLADGRSAFWLRAKPGTPEVTLTLGDAEVAFARQGTALSFVVDGDVATALETPGSKWLRMHCGGQVLDQREIVVAPRTRLPADAPAYAGPPRPRLVAHAGGFIHGQAYTNSREALDHNYAAGIRHFELDIEWTRDDVPVLVHDWEGTWERLFGGGPRPDLAGFRAAPMAHGLTALTLADALAWLEAHPDAVIITDTKGDNLRVLEWIAKQAPALRGRIIPQVYGPGEIGPARALGFKELILTVYRSPLPPTELIEVTRRERLWALTVPEARVRDGAFDQALLAPDIFLYVHTVNSEADAAELQEGGVDGFYTDGLAP